MQVNEAVFMEPMLFTRKPKFLAGSGNNNFKVDYINDKKLALHLLFDQDLPKEFMVWSDFFAEITSALILHPMYKESQKTINDNMLLSKGDAIKENIRKRKDYLLKKQMGLAENKDYADFTCEVSDEAIYMLNMVSTQRYIKGIMPSSILEIIYDIYKEGCIPCGVKKDMNIVVFNPAILK